MFYNVLIFSLAAGLASLGGAYLVFYFSGWAKKNLIFLISLAVGVLLANAFFHLLPEAMELTPFWPYWTLGAIAFFYLMEQGIMVHACAEEECEVHTMGEVSLMGIGFHSLVDGLTIGVAFQAGFIIGLLAALAVILHKIAEGGCLYTLLISGRFSKKLSLIFSWLVAAMTPLGALPAFYFVRLFPNEVLGWLLAAAAGSFIYIGASDLVPATHREHNWLNVVLMMLGIGFVWVLGRLA